MFQLPDGAVRISTGTHAFAMASYIIAVAFGVTYTLIDTSAISMHERLGPILTTLWAMMVAVSGLACIYGASITTKVSGDEVIKRRRLEMYGCLGLATMFGLYEYSLFSRNGFFEFPATELLSMGFSIGALARVIQIITELRRVRRKRDDLRQMVSDATGEAADDGLE